VVRVLLDATAVPHDRGGVGRYVDELVPALTALDVRPQVVCRRGDVDHYAELSGTAPLVAPKLADSPAQRLIWEQTGLPALVRQANPDVFHSPHYTRPMRSHIPSVVTLHDATFFTDPHLHSKAKGPFFRAATRHSLRHAQLCLVPSQATADELAAVVGVDAARMRVAHHGVDTELFAPPSAQEIAVAREQIGLAPSELYIAFLGTLEPRKNVAALIAAWADVAAQKPEPLTLVLAGAAGWDTTLEAAIAAVPSGLRVLRPGYLRKQDLAGFLGGAELVCYPSLMEGFGLPVLEAMACGAAVLTTRRGALPEVGGDAVEYTETDSAAIGTALSALLAHPAHRKELGAAAVQRAATFTWAESARRHIEAYEFAAASSAVTGANQPRRSA
jgi:glycosyltransferase involved in cell wall biosynthesis